MWFSIPCAQGWWTIPPTGPEAVTAGMGLAPVLPWMAADGLLAQFAKRRSVTQQHYAQFVMEGIKAPSP
jgi:hypothetical protein